MIKTTSTFTMEVSLQDFTETKKQPTTGTNHTRTKLSKKDQAYKQLGSLTTLEESNSKSLNHQQIGIITYQSCTYITYLGKDPLEVHSLNKILSLHPSYKKPLLKQTFVPLHQLKSLEKGILKNQIYIKNHLEICSSQPIQCRQILEILSLRDQLWPNPPFQ